MRTTTTLFALLLLATPVCAAGVNDPIMTDNGVPMQDCLKMDDVDKTKCAKFTDYLVGTALARTIDQRYQGEENMKLSDIVARGRLATKIRDAIAKGAEIKFTPEEVTMIKTLIPKAGQSARITLQMCVAVDPDCS